MMPFEYNFKEECPEGYVTLLPSQKDKVDVFTNQVIPAVMVNSAGCYPLGKAGLTPLKSLEYNGKVNFAQRFGEKGTKENALSIFNTDINYWTQELWDQLLILAEPYM